MFILNIFFSLTDITENLIPIPRAPHSLSSVNLHVHEIENGDESSGSDRPLKRHSSFQFHDKSWDSSIGLSAEVSDPLCHVITSSSSSSCRSSISSSGGGSSTSGSSRSSRTSQSGSSDVSETALDTTTLQDPHQEKDQGKKRDVSRRNTRSTNRTNYTTMTSDLQSSSLAAQDTAEPPAKKQTRKRSLSTKGTEAEAPIKATRPASRRIKKGAITEIPDPTVTR